MGLVSYSLAGWLASSRSWRCLALLARRQNSGLTAALRTPSPRYVPLKRNATIATDFSYNRP